MYEYTLRELIDLLNAATASYDAGNPVMSDEEWDKLYFQLKQKEELDGIIYPDSPTQKIYFEKVSELPKAIHQFPMLSLDKTKDPSDIESFVKGQDWMGMFKLDGLSCQLTYINGKLIRGETRGNGIEGEDITHNVKVIKNIPQYIKTKEERIIINGEILCKYSDFKAFENEYANPRNFAAGSIRLLDATECGRRNLSFVAWDLVLGYSDIDFFFWRLEKLDDWGFETVPRVGDAETIHDAMNILDDMCDGKDCYKNSKYQDYPIDGYVFRFESQKYYDSLGSTDHHSRGAQAFKFYDEEYETRLLDIEYTMGRTGILTPVAIFEDVDTGDSICNRASLHNLSIMEQTLGKKPFKGQTIMVSKRNQIIPKIERAKDEKGQWI